MSGPASPSGVTRTGKYWGDTVKPGVCRDTRCRARIWFATNCKTHNAMPFDGDPTAVYIDTETETGRQIWTVDLALSHFVTCPGSKHFRRTR